MSMWLERYWYLVRVDFAQRLLTWAFRVAPDGPEQKTLAKCWLMYFKEHSDHEWARDERGL